MDAGHWSLLCGGFENVGLTDMQLGKGIKGSAAEKLAAKVGAELRDGEVITRIGKCNNFKPLVDRVLLTDQRLLAVNVTDGKIKYSADRDQVADVVANSKLSGATLTVTKTDGTETVLKSMDVTDAEAFQAA